MKIALIGYGKMGKAIEQIATSREHEITTRIQRSNAEAWDSDSLKETDVVIEFTGPEPAPENLKKCFELGLPVVCGSTGWLSKWDEIVQACHQANGSLIFSSNFSVGVNILFALNDQLAKLMARHPSYKVSIEEIHHTEKKDAPSGTAISIAQQIIEHLPQLNKWENSEISGKDAVPIASIRQEGVPGTHRIEYRSEIDSIELKHTAHNRIGFATGAVLAAEFLRGKKGVYSMSEVLGIGV